jgi:hypothetical protein
VEPVAHMTDSQRNTEPLYASCARTPASRLTVWRCHNVLRQQVIPHALGTSPRSLAKEYRLAEAENSPPTSSHLTASYASRRRALTRIDCRRCSTRQ